jgi:tetratricopeptide (TPR) repeat protein
LPKVHVSWTRPVLPVLLLALALRLLFAAETFRDPLFAILTIDARSYHELALRFLAGDWTFGREPLWFPPFYPTFLGSLYSVVGPNPAWARLFQLVLDSATAALVASLAARFSSSAGWIAGCLYALHPVPLFYANQLLLESWATFFTALFLSSFARLSGSDPRGRGILPGIALGLLSLVRSNALVFAPVAALLAARRHSSKAALVFLAGTALTLVPLLLRNGLVAGHWSPLGVNGGMIFATGFRSESLGGRALERTPEDFGPRGKFELEAERALGRELSLAEASRFHRDQALRWIREHPREGSSLTLRKFLLLVNAREIDDNLSFPTFRPRSTLLKVLPVSWALIATLAVAGAGVALGSGSRWRREASAPLLFGITYAASLLLLFVNARYRVPLLVPGAVLAAAGLAAAPGIRLASWRRKHAFALLASAAAPLLVLRDPNVRADPALELTALGAGLERDGHHREALLLTEEALRLNPSIAGAHQNRALALLSLGREREALTAAEEATRLDPDLSAAWLTRGALLAREGRMEQALGAFQRAVALSPENPDALSNLARALASLGRFEEAIGIGRRAGELGAQGLASELLEWEASLYGGGQAD